MTTSVLNAPHPSEEVIINVQGIKLLTTVHLARKARYDVLCFHRHNFPSLIKETLGADSRVLADLKVRYLVVSGLETLILYVARVPGVHHKVEPWVLTTFSYSIDFELPDKTFESLPHVDTYVSDHYPQRYAERIEEALCLAHR